MKKLVTSAAAAAVLAGGSLVAGDYGKAIIDDKAPIEADPWSICDIFDYSTLFDNGTQKIKFIGRYHGQWEDTSGENGNQTFGDREWRHRRWRAGISAQITDTLSFANTYNLDTSQHFNGGMDARFVDSVEEMVLEWEPNDDFFVIIGKQKPEITREYSTSSKRIKTFERSQIVNAVTADKSWGVSTGFGLFGLDHVFGFYMNAVDDDWRFPNNDGGAMFTYSTSVEVTDSTEVFFDYQYSDVNEGLLSELATANGVYRGSNYEHVIAIGTESDFGRLGLVTDLIFGFDRQDDLGGLTAGDNTVGVVVMPYYEITEKLEAVFRYAYGSNIRVEDSFDNVDGTNLDNASLDELHTLYFGLTYRICDDKLKLMAGYEHAFGTEVVSNDDYDAGSWLLGVRTYW